MGWIPHYDPALAPERPSKDGFESHPTRQNEIFHACFRALLSEFSDCEPEAEVIPWGDGINRVTVFRLGGIIGDQQELPGSRPRDKSGCRVPQVRNS